MSLEIVDIDTSIGYNIGQTSRFTEPAQLVDALDTYRISSAVTFHTDALRDSIRGNALAAKAAQDHSGRLHSCYVLRPDLGSSEMPSAIDLADQISAQKPAAIKLYPQAQRYLLSKFYSGELLEVLDSLHMPVLLDHDQKPDNNFLPDLAVSYPNIKFIILKQALNETRIIRPLIKKLQNVYFSVGTIIDTCFIEEVARDFGSSKLLFGSRMPHFMPAGALGMVLYSRISESDKNAILSGNWKRIQEEIQWK